MDQVSEVAAVRLVTAAEIEHYRELGWVQLERFVDPTYLRTLLDMAQSRMGDDGDGNGPPKAGLPYFNAEPAGGWANDRIRDLIHQVGSPAAALMGRPREIGIRYLNDMFVPKLPASRPSRHGGNGGTDFHQDYISFGVDRSGGMTFWFPLEAYGPESGTLSFIDGSHRMGVLGDYRTFGEDSIFGAHPELGERKVSGPLTYRLGDVSVHSHLTVHGASINLTARPRWSYILILQPADIRWTGQRTGNFDPDRLRPYQAMSDDDFPVISRPAKG